MYAVRAATLEEVLASWVRAETASARFGGSLAAARAAGHASDAELLGVTRGWPDREYFRGFPSDVTWSLVRLGVQELRAVLYIDWDYWLEVSGGTRLAAEAARRQSWTETLDPRGVEPLILLTDPERSRLVVVEGHARLTRYVIGGAEPVDCYLGISPRASEWWAF